MAKEKKILIDKKNFLTVPNIHEVPENNHSENGDEPNLEIDSDLSKLKAMTARLNLATKRPSYIEWRAKFMDKPDLIRTVSTGICSKETQNKPWTNQTVQDINQALVWLRNELIAMRSQDQDLARTLISIRHDIHALKLEWSCDEHKMALEEAKEELEEDDLLAELCDCPLDLDPLSPMASLKEFGITRMNISTRRYSIL